MDECLLEPRHCPKIQQETKNKRLLQPRNDGSLVSGCDKCFASRIVERMLGVVRKGPSLRRMHEHVREQECVC